MSENQAKALALIPKVSGPLSIFGSCWIIYEIIKDRKKKFKKPYHRLLFSMCIMDVLSSTCLALSTWPIPSATSDRWGASGNDATCSAQAFFIQANISSPIFNFMLSLFFLLKIKYRYTDKQLSKFIEPAMQASTLLFGLGTAAYCVGMDLFADSSLWCWINATPKGCVQTFQLDDKDKETTTCITGDNAGIYRWAFFFAPLWAAAIGSMIAMAILYYYVRQTEKSTQSYDFELAYAKKQMAKEQQQQQQQQQSAIAVVGGVIKGGAAGSDGDINSTGSNDGSNADLLMADPVRDSNGSIGDILADVAGDHKDNDHCSHIHHRDDILDDISLCSSVLSTGTNKSNTSTGSGAPSVRYISRQVSNKVNAAWRKRKQLKKLQNQKRRECKKSKIVARQAYRYVGVFYITWIAGTTNRLLQLINGKSFYWIMVLHAIFTPLQGFFNWLVYMYPKWERRRSLKRQERKRKLREQHQSMMLLDQSDQDHHHHSSNYVSSTHGNGMFSGMMKEVVVFFGGGGHPARESIISTISRGEDDAKGNVASSCDQPVVDHTTKTITTAESSIYLRNSSNAMSSSSNCHAPADNCKPTMAPVEEKSSLNDNNQLIGGQIMCSLELSADPHSIDGKADVVAVDDDISSDEESVSPQSPAAEMGDINDGRVFEIGHA